AEAQSKGERTRGEGDAERNRIFADAYGRDPDFFSFYRSMQAYEAGLRANDTRMLLKPDSEFFRYFVDPSGKSREGGAQPGNTPPARYRRTFATTAPVRQRWPSSSPRSASYSSSKDCFSPRSPVPRNGSRRARWRARKRRCGSRASPPPCSASC